MYIKCWGSRGSIPVSGPEYHKYGGDTTCIEIRTKSGELIIVDAGTGMRRLGNQLTIEGCRRFNVLFTHSHWDHLLGFPFFKPLFDPESEIRIYRCPFPGKFVETIVTKMMSPPHFPVRYSDLRAKISYIEACPGSFQIDSVTVTPIALSHPNNGCGYKFVEDGKVFVFLTDNELGYTHAGGLKFKDYKAFCEGADLLFHDAEYTPDEYESSVEWGHTTYKDALELALEAGVKRLGLIHHNRDRTDQGIDHIVNQCRNLISERKAGLICFAVGRDMSFEL